MSHICVTYKWFGASLVIQTVKNLPAMREAQVQFQAREDPLENGVQYSCQENSLDGGAWQATVHGIAKSWT